VTDRTLHYNRWYRNGDPNNAEQENSAMTEQLEYSWGAEFAAAFVKAQAAMTDITKGRTAKVAMKEGGSYSYSYADLADVLSDARPVLTANGLALSQSIVTNGRDVEVWTTVLHVSGQYRTDGPIAFNGGSNPQQAGSAITYARRYAALASLGLASEDDDGAKAADGHTSSQRGKSAPAEPTFTAEAVALFAAVKAAAGTAVADELKQFAGENGRKLTVAAFDADPVYAEQIATILRATP
jgi:hypothetical protein